MGSKQSTHNRLQHWWFTADATPLWSQGELVVRPQTSPQVEECERPPGAPVAACTVQSDVRHVCSRAEPPTEPVHAVETPAPGAAEDTPSSVTVPVSATPEAGDAVHPPKEADKAACVLGAMLARRQQAGPSPMVPQGGGGMGAMLAQIKARGGAEAHARPQMGGGMGAMLAQIRAKGNPKEASQAQQTAEPVVDQAAIDTWKKRLRLNNNNRELIYNLMERAGVLPLVPAVLGDFKPTQQQQQQHAQYEKDVVVRARRAVLAEGATVEPWAAELEQVVRTVKSEKATLFPHTEPKRAKQAVKAPVAAAAKAKPAATLFAHFTRTMAVNVVIKKLDGSGSGIIDRIDAFAFARAGDDVAKLFTLLPTEAEVEVLSNIPDAEWPTYFSGLNEAERMVATMYKSPAATLCVRHMAFMTSFADTLSWAKGILQSQMDMMRGIMEDGMLRRLTTLVTAVSCGLNGSDDRTPFRFLELSPQLTSVKAKDGSGLLLIDIIVKVGMQCGQGDLLSRVVKTLGAPSDRMVDLRTVDEQVTSALTQFDQFGRAIPAAPAVAASLGGGGVLLRKASSGTTLEEDDKEGTDTDARFGRSESTGPTNADASQPSPSDALKATAPQNLLHETQLAHLRAFVAERTPEVEAIKALLREAMDLRSQLYTAVYEAVPRGKPANKDEADPLVTELFRVGPVWKAAVERYKSRTTAGTKSVRPKVLKVAPVRAATGA